MDLDELREEIYNDFIQEYHWMTNDQISDLVDKELMNRMFGEEFMKSNDKGTLKEY